MSPKIGSVLPPGRSVPAAILYGVGSTLAVLVSWYCFGPVQIRMGVNVDASHVWTIAWAFQNGYTWGSEILFTYGPLGFLRAQTFLPEGGLLPVILAYVYYGLLGFLLWRAFRPGGMGGTLFALAILAGTGVLMVAYDAIVFFVLLVGGYFCLERRGWVPAEKILFLAFCALNFYVKYSLTILVLCLLLLLVAWWMVFRRQGYLVWVLVGLLFAVGWLAGLGPMAVLQYVFHTWPIASGFSKAMQLWGPMQEWLVFLTLISLVNTIYFLHCLRVRPWEVIVFHWLWILLLCFFAWKQGFVRHDAHATAGSAFLLLLVLFWLKEQFTARCRIGNRQWGGALLLMIGALMAAGYFTSTHQHYLGDDYFSKRLSYFGSRPVETFRERVLQPFDQEVMREKQRARVVRLRERLVLPEGIDGTVDFYDHRSGMVLAHDLDYRPRPVFQSYSAYTPSLIQKNRAFLRGDRAPRYLITDLATVNRRPPMLNDGVSWLEIWGRYRPIRRERRLLLWERVGTDEIQVPELELVAEGSGKIRENLSLEAWHGELLWIELEFKKTLIGRLQNLLFKPSPLIASLRFDQSRELEHEIAPGMVQTGFLLSPYLDHPESMERFLALVGDSGSPLWVRSPDTLRIREDRHLLRSFHRAFRYRVYRLNLDGAPGTTGVYLRQIESGIWGELAAYKNLTHTGPGPWPRVVEAHPELPAHLFAHAPSRFVTDAPEAAMMEISYGLYDGSWQGGNATDGVRFRISGIEDEASSPTVLWERDLRPVEDVGDRGLQRSAFAIPGSFSRLIFEVEMRGNPNWDWSYWGSLRSVDSVEPEG